MSKGWQANASGNMLFHPSGKWMGWCCCDICEGNGCYPLLACCYKLTWSGLARSFAAYNGAHTVKWYASVGGSCLWSPTGDLTPPGVVLQWNTNSSLWEAWVRITPTTCRIILNGGSDGCAPTGTYTTLNSCIDSGCADTDSCEDTSSPICVVSNV